MKKSILMALVCCICLLSGCAGDLKLKCREFNETVRSDISEAAEAYQNDDDERLTLFIGSLAGKIEAASIFGCERSD